MPADYQGTGRAQIAVFRPSTREWFLRNESGKTSDLAEQARLQGEIAEAERRQRKLRQEIFEIEDRIMAERDPYFLGHSVVEQQRLQQQARELADESRRFFQQIAIPAFVTRRPNTRPACPLPLDDM